MNIDERIARVRAHVEKNEGRERATFSLDGIRALLECADTFFKAKAGLLPVASMTRYLYGQHEQANLNLKSVEAMKLPHGSYDLYAAPPAPSVAMKDFEFLEKVISEMDWSAFGNEDQAWEAKLDGDAVLARIRSTLSAQVQDVAGLSDTALVRAVLAAAVDEYLLDHPSESDTEKTGRHSAIRGMMVRLGIYPAFCGELPAAPAKQAD